MRSGRRAPVLLVMRKGGARALAVRVLSRIGEVRVAADPYEASARFGAEGAGLVVAALRRWRRADLGFVSAVRARDAAVPVLLLVPEGARTLAVEALRRGADAYVLDPFDPDELAAVAARLCARPEGARPAPRGSVERLTGEVAHAVNNPLQVMSLLLEEAADRGDLEAGWVARMRAEVERVREALGVLSAYGERPAPASTPTDLGALLLERTEAAARAGLVRPSAARSPRALALADAEQVGRALDAILRFLAARADARPVDLRVAVRRGRRPGAPRVEAAIRAAGVALDGSGDDALDAVLLTDERTRVSYPGLALPRAIAEAHGGRIRLRATGRGAVVGLILPAAT